MVVRSARKFLTIHVFDIHRDAHALFTEIYDSLMS